MFLLVLLYCTRTRLTKHIPACFGALPVNYSTTKVPKSKTHCLTHHKIPTQYFQNLFAFSFFSLLGIAPPAFQIHFLSIVSLHLECAPSSSLSPHAVQKHVVRWTAVSNLLTVGSYTL